MIIHRKRGWMLWLAMMLVLAGLGLGTPSTPRAEAADAESYNLKLMTFNIRNGGAGEAGEWDTHKDVVVRAIDSFGPDVLGMQEGHQSGIEYLLNHLNGPYGSIGTSRFGNTEDEYNNILYRSDKFDVVQSGQFWLSDYPDVVGSKSPYDPAYPRICTWAKFKAKDNPKAEFYYFNTHFGLTAGAQSQGASVILDQIAKYVISPDVPVFLSGDLNGQEDSQAVQTLQNSSLDDTWAGAGHAYTDDDGTYSNFDGSTNTGHIDWIFQRNVSHIQSIEINRYNENGLYPSDHYPVQLVVDIPLTGRVGTVVPGAPRNVYAATGEGLTKVIFTPSSDDGGSDVLQYKVTVLKDGASIKTIVGNASPIAVTGLDADGEYTFIVTAVNAVGESVPSVSSKPISELANQSLGKPYLSGGVSSNRLLSGTLTITPTSLPADEQEYALYWGDVGGKLAGVQPIATIPASEGDVSYTFNKIPVPSGATAVLVYTRILGYDSTIHAEEPLPTAGVQPMQIEDFADVSDWTDLRYGKITAADGIGLISVNGPAGRTFGYAGIPVTYNLTDLPILHVKIDSLDDGAMWALKLHTKPNQGSGDIKIQGDTNETGEFIFDLRKATGWNGEKSFIIKLFPIGVEKSFLISELSARPAVELGDDGTDPLPTEPSTPSTSPAQDNAPVVDNSVVTSASGTIVIPAGRAGEVALGEAALVTVPAGAAEQELRITIEKLLDKAQWKTNQGEIVSDVFEMLKNVSGNFKTPVKVSLKFDPSAVKEGQKIAIFYYDENAKTWIDIGGKIEGERITAEVAHFTKFAVLAVKQADGGKPNPSNSPLPMFSDIAGHWAESNIARAADSKLVAGYPNGTFKPDTSVTRAEFTVMLMNALKQGNADGKPAFKDQDQVGEWAEKAIAQAVAAGIVSGYPDGTFRPSSSITRAEMAVMVAKALQLPMVPAEEAGFADDTEIPQWAKAAVKDIRELGMISGREGNMFAPSDLATRAEVVTLLLKTLEQHK